MSLQYSDARVDIESDVIIGSSAYCNAASSGQTSCLCTNCCTCLVLLRFRQKFPGCVNFNIHLENSRNNSHNKEYTTYKGHGKPSGDHSKVEYQNSLWQWYLPILHTRKFPTT